MSTLFQQDFNGLTPGTSAVPGFFQANGIVGVGDYFGGAGNHYFLGNLGWHDSVNYYQTCTVYFAIEIFSDNNIGSGQVLVIQNINQITGQGPSLLILQLEGDQTLSLYSDTIFMGNSNLPITANGWTWLQVDAKFGSIVNMGVTVVTTEARLFISGNKVFDNFGGPTITSFKVANLSDAFPDVNTFIWANATQQGSNVDVITGLSPVVVSTPVGEPTYPNLGSPKARISQTVDEYAGLVNNSKARLTQTIVEDTLLPDNTNARISQMIIELITQGGSFPVGFVVSES